MPPNSSHPLRAGATRAGCGLLGVAAFFVSALLVVTPLFPAPIVVALVLVLGLRRAWHSTAPGDPARAQIVAFAVGVALGAAALGVYLALAATGRVGIRR